MSRIVSPWLALFAVFVTGCASTPDLPVAAHHPGDEPATVHTPKAGHYELVRASDGTPVERLELGRDASVGFMKASDDRVYAKAAGELFPLDDGTDYYWSRLPLTHREALRHGLNDLGSELVALPGHLLSPLYILCLYPPLLLLLCGVAAQLAAR